MTDYLARFLYSSKWFAANAEPGNQVKHAAFMPYEGEVSMVQLLPNIEKNKLYELNKKYGRPNKTFYGYGKICEADVDSVENLEVIHDENWEGLHANIIGWPEDKRDKQDLAKQLAVIASLNLFND